MTRLLFFIFLIIVCNLANAQNEPQFTQYMFNRMLLNPAFAGSKKGLDVSAIVRLQYLGLSNRISTTQGLALSSSVHALHGGVGLSVANDLIGVQRTTSMNVSYAYQQHFSNLSLGIAASVGFINTNIDGSKIITPDGNYNYSISHNDEQLPIINAGSFSPDFSGGIYICNKKFFVSLSGNHLYTSQTIKGIYKMFTFKYDRNIQLSGGYDFRLSKHINIQPSILVKSNFQKIQFDVSSIIAVYNNIITGVSFRGYSMKTIDALALFLGANIRDFKIIYSYDVNLSFLKGFNTGTHEVGVSCFLPYRIKETKGYFYHNSRYL